MLHTTHYPVLGMEGHYSPLFCPDELPSSSVERGFEAKHFEWGRPVSIKRCSSGGHLSSLGAVGAKAPRHSGRTQEPRKQEQGQGNKNEIQNRRTR